MSGHWDAPHPDHGHGRHDIHHGEKAHASGDHENKAGSPNENKAGSPISSRNDTPTGTNPNWVSTPQNKAGSPISSRNDTPTGTNPNRVSTPPDRSDTRSSFEKGLAILYNTTVGALISTLANTGHAILNTAVRTTAGTVSGMRDTIKQTAHEIQDNFSTASRKDKWHKRWAGYLWSALSTPGIALEWTIRTASEVINTAKSVFINIASNKAVHQAKTIKAMGTSTHPSQVNAHRAWETREQPSRRKEKFWLNPRHRYNKASEWFGGWGHTTPETPKTESWAHH